MVTRLLAKESAPPPWPPATSATPATGPFVVDASVSASWFLPDEMTAYTQAAQLATVRGHVWVPALWTLEMANLLRNAERRRRISAATRLAMAEAASALRLHICNEPVSLQRIDALAAEHDLSAYDACYLELALRRGLPLATLDRPLLKAMKRCGVPEADLPTE